MKQKGGYPMEKQAGVASVTFRKRTPHEIIELAKQAGLGTEDIREMLEGLL